MKRIEVRSKKREIKFRIWDTSALDWLEEAHFIVHCSGNLLYVPGHLILTQFTGLHDLLGTDIYEGDIVSVENAAWGVITFGAGCFRVEHPDGHKLALEDTQESMLRVIGNIYKHPELPTGGEQ